MHIVLMSFGIFCRHWWQTTLLSCFFIACSICHYRTLSYSMNSIPLPFLQYASFTIKGCWPFDQPSSFCKTLGTGLVSSRVSLNGLTVYHQWIVIKCFYISSKVKFQQSFKTSNINSKNFYRLCIA